MRYSTFLGKRMAQTERAITLWEKVLFRVPFSRIIEIGTFHGGFSTYLLLVVLSHGKEFYTFDICNWRDYDHSPRIKNILDLDSHFYQKDVFENVEFVSNFIKKRGITILFCDGGNKEKEFNTFVPIIKKGDIIAVHDWKTEVLPEHLNLDGMEEFKPLECDKEEMTRFFKKL
jgi:cephalosporin hydroxylase